MEKSEEGLESLYDEGKREGGSRKDGLKLNIQGGSLVVQWLESALQRQRDTGFESWLGRSHMP